ncbi:MAG: hypothetical protein AAGG75_18920 [Bacteroidota bacterium]
MDISKEKCLIFISRIIPKSGQNSLEGLDQILRFKEDQWKTLDVSDGSTVSAYYIDEARQAPMIKINGYSYCYFDREPFWDQFSMRVSEGDFEEMEESFWLFEKILATVRRLNAKLDAKIEDLFIFTHWGGDEFDRKNEKIKQCYQAFKKQQAEQAAGLECYFETFSYNNKNEQNISGKIYDVCDAEPLLAAIEQSYAITEGQLRRNAYTKFIDFEDQQILNNPSFLEQDEQHPKSIQFILNGKEDESDPQEENIPQNGIDQQDANDIFSGD